ncbi:bifunctional metallophosphatase/5'-nucleotidase [Candidatus Halobonum tyrrellensis]|uniref:5'-nucleotidase n=1 Tax=Candidatus Halobonum tyrrellensis G22 TaxID=1324957 RepID=V4GUQ7_9EURY|nr:bifunctional metallophosphatase/5'-nucleotidase [Candidatus Halobonum tyrrellensis]ESP88856.1 5'-nucleotidase [Candidatus Halobonum tyrrellensis G22]
MVRLLHYSDIENVYDDPERAGRLAGLLAELDGDDALVVGSGDDTAPGVLALVARGRQALDFFEAVDAAVETFGNHDFDFGPDATRELVSDAPQTWVGANVYAEEADPEAVRANAADLRFEADDSGDAGVPAPGAFGAAEGVVPWTVEPVAGERVGLFGVTDPATDSLNPMAADLAFTDPLVAAERAVDALRDAGADRVVAVSHLGNADDDLARVDGVDAVLGGHVHTRRVETVDGTLCTRPGVNGEAVVEVDLGAGDAGTDRPATGTLHDLASADAPVDERLADALRARMRAAGLDRTVGHAATPIERTQRTVHGGESRVGNLVADAYRYAADADVGLQNAGGIRLGDPLVGEVTVADLISVVPFEEQVVVAELTGAELREAFRQMSASVVDFGRPGWWHGHVSGAELVFDDAADELVSARVGGEPLDDDAVYRVATPEYLLHSDHEFPVIEERHRAGECGIQHDALAAYIRAEGLDPRVEGRIRRVNRERAAGGTADAGDETADAGGESVDAGDATVDE